ncbi:MAG: MFS transporter [Silicimonas sp.]|nr:MFS transporter [Silicimonas sp.]
MSALRFIRDNLSFLSAGMILTLNSSFGQTFFISIFAAQILAEFSLTNGEWGLIYTIGTTASAALMFWAGALTDHFRARALAVIVMPALALTCIAMGLNRSATGLLFIVFFLRLFGQGMIFQLATVSMARWFAARRGLALSLSAIGFWAGQAAFPVVFAALLLRFDWHLLWYIAAAFVMLCFPVVLWLLAQERTPQALAKEAQTTGIGGRHWTRGEVIQSRFFWLLLPLLIGTPAWGTALFFQQVHIAEIKGWNLVEYLALIPLMTLVSVGVTLATGALIDRFGSGRLLQFFPLTWIAGFVVLAIAGNLGVASIAFVIFGVATGMQASLITAFWAEYFGTRHIGAIKATSASIMVFGSAVGPGISGYLIDLGYLFPDQMLFIAGYFLVSMCLVWIAVERASGQLPSKIDVESA